jgi:FkbM family methyltransferase
VGSAEGFYSALFASIHRTEAEILTIDCGSTAGCNPAHTTIVLHQNAAEFRPSRWDYVRAFVTDSTRQQPSFSLPADCRIATLPEIMEDSGFVPELIKMDIESSEYEVLLDSLEWLEATAPVLIIEVHNNFLASRRLDFAPVLEALKRIGYRLVAKDHDDYLRVDSHLVLEPPR